MTPKQKKQKAFLDDTVNHFNSTNRAWDKEKELCSYSHSINGGCAIGRKCSEARAEKLEKKTGVVFSVWSLIPVRMKALGQDFLTKVQQLHDDERCWNKKGLNEEGKEEYKYICKEFGLTN